MDRLDPVKAPPPIPRAPATRRERRRQQPDSQANDEPPKGRDETEDDPDNQHTIDEYV